MSGERIRAFCAGALIVAGSVSAATASTAGVASGPALTLGAVSHPHAPTAGRNPAALPLSPVVGTALLRLGGGVEIGPVDNLVDELEDLQDFLDRDDLGVTEAEEVVERFDAFLRQAGEEGYVKVSAFGHVPLTPLSVRSPWGPGAVSVDVRYTGQSRLNVLDAPLVVDLTGGNADLSTNTSLYIKGAVVREIAVGYGRPVWRGGRGELMAGATVTHYQADLSKVVIPLQDTDDVGDAIADEYDANQVTSTAWGADLGFLWVTPFYRAGAVGRNLNAPEFSYGAIGQDCAALSGGEQTRCEAAQSFAHRIDLDETWTMDPQLTLEGAVHTEDQVWVVAASVDVNEVRDPVGDPVQWATVSISTASPVRLMPAWRFGYRANLAGSELRYVTTGLTLFRFLELDIAYALDGVEFEDEDYPRGVMFNVGLGLSF